MGNNGPSYDGGSCPAHMSEVITVGGASNPTDVWNSSSRGSESDGMSKPDLCAPSDLVTTWMRPGNHFDKYTEEITRIRAKSDEELVALFRDTPSYSERWQVPSEVFSQADAGQRLRGYLPRWYRIDSTHLMGDGTSLAAPLVSGIAATLIQARPNATPAMLKQILMATARPMDAGYSRFDAGAGFVDTRAALTMLLAALIPEGTGPGPSPGSP